METGLAGRTALVSGGSKGIGKGIARSLAREGVSVALLARTEHEVLAAAQEIAGETGATVVGVQADVSDTNSLKAAVAHLSGLASFNALNIVVNNAAPPITRADRQIEWTDKEWSAAIDVKTIGALRLIRETIHLIPHDGTGPVINVAGGSGIAVWRPALLHGPGRANRPSSTPSIHVRPILLCRCSSLDPTRGRRHSGGSPDRMDGQRVVRCD